MFLLIANNAKELESRCFVANFRRSGFDDEEEDASDSNLATKSKANNTSHAVIELLDLLRPFPPQSDRSSIM
jgi:hypothetical protein